MVSTFTKLVVSSIVALVTLVILATQGANWKVTTGITGVVFASVFIFITFRVSNRDPRIGLLNDWEKQAKQRNKAQYDLTANQRNYRTETRSKFFKEQDKLCREEGKVYNPKSNKCTREFKRKRGY